MGKAKKLAQDAPSAMDAFKQSLTERQKNLTSTYNEVSSRITEVEAELKNLQSNKLRLNGALEYNGSLLQELNVPVEEEAVEPEESNN